MSEAIITKEDMEILEAQSPDVLAQWACILNGSEWPEGLPNPESPGGWSLHHPELPKRYRRTALLYWIIGWIGPKRFSQEWNCRYRAESRRMTLEQHDEWWIKEQQERLDMEREHRLQPSVVVPSIGGSFWRVA